LRPDGVKRECPFLGPVCGAADPVGRTWTHCGSTHFEGEVLTVVSVINRRVCSPGSASLAPARGRSKAWHIRVAVPQPAEKQTPPIQERSLLMEGPSIRRAFFGRKSTFFKRAGLRGCIRGAAFRVRSVKAPVAQLDRAPAF
jgi:hypothetical protein